MGLRQAEGPRRGDPREDGRAAAAAAAGRPTRQPSAITATPGSSRTCCEAIRKGTARRLIDGPEGRRSVEIILAIYKAAETGRAVKLPLAGDPPLRARKSGVRPAS